MHYNSLRLPQISSMTGIKRHTLNARLKTHFDQAELERNSGNQILLNPLQINKIIQDQFINKECKIVYIGNLKGGVGKTTLTHILSNATSSLGLKTCLLDLDVQANASCQHYNIDENETLVFYDIIEKGVHISDTIVKISDTFHLLPSSLKNSLVEKALTMQQPKHQINWLNSICLDYLRNNYDIVIIDTPPNLTTLNSVFCLCLNDIDNILIPVCPEDFSIMGVTMFLEDIMEIRKSYGIESDVSISIIMNRFFQNQKTNLEMLLKMGKLYEGMMSETIIRDNAKIRELMNNKQSLGEIKKGKEIYEIVSSLLQELKIIKGTVN